MSLTLVQLRSMLRSMTGHDSTTLPDSDGVDPSGEVVIGINTFMNMAWWNMINVLELREKEVSGSQNTVDGTEFYSISSIIESVRKISYVDPDTFKRVVLEQRDIKWLRTQQSTDELERGKPLIYVRENDGFYIWPVPDDIYSLTIDYLSPLTDDVTTGITAPRETGEIIKYGAAWRIFSDVNQNVQKASFYKGLEKNLLDAYTPVKAKEEDDNPLAGLEVLGRDYD